jgi:hypothetical protein
MPPTKYRPIRDVQRNGTVSKTVIREAVQKIADLRRTNPSKYKAKIQSGLGKRIQLVVKHG